MTAAHRKPSLRQVVWTLRWGNPYTSPPEGQPYIRGVQITSSSAHKPTALLLLKSLGDGYALYCDPIRDPTASRKLSEEAKQKIRRRNLERRIDDKAPLFKDEILEKELAARVEYFGGKSIPTSDDKLS